MRLARKTKPPTQAATASGCPYPGTRPRRAAKKAIAPPAANEAGGARREQPRCGREDPRKTHGAAVANRAVGWTARPARRGCRLALPNAQGGGVACLPGVLPPAFPSARGPHRAVVAG